MRRAAKIAAVVAALLLAIAPSASAQDAVTTRQAAELAAELDAVRDSISVSERRATELTEEIEAMGTDRAQLNAELIAAARRVGLAEIEVDAVEERLLGLRAEESRIAARLDDEDRGIAGLVASMQRIGLSPPPAMVVDPADALSSARAAILLAAVLPQLRARAQLVLTDLEALRQVRTAAEAEEAVLRENLNTLSEERLRIATMIEARKRGVLRATEALAAEQERAEALAAEAASLDQLVEAMEREIETVTQAAEAARAAAENAVEPAAAGDDAIRLAFADADRSEPAVPFPSARGYLRVPVNGVRVLDFGASDGFGGTAQGVSIVTRAEAQVVSPADGWVVYRGPYLNYGQIVILNAGNGFNILLAGLDSVAVELGQFVLMGEPVGQMGARTIAQTVATGAGMSRPTLYIELRNDGTPIDPAEWWASEPPAVLEG